MTGSFTSISVYAAGLLDVISDALVASRLVWSHLTPHLRRLETMIKLIREQAIWKSRESLLRSWILVPSGILIILVACFGVDTFFKHFGVAFPASVACMLLLLAGLWMCELAIGRHRTRTVVAVIDVPVSLTWNRVILTKEEIEWHVS